MPKLAHLAITDRDLAILRMAFEYGGVSSEHIRRRFFPTRGGRSPCYERISRLVKAGYLISKRLPSWNGIGSGKLFLIPGPAARPLLARALGLSRTELGRLRLDSPLFIQHRLGLCDTRLATEIACEQSGVFTLREWAGDHELKHEPMKVKDPKTEEIFSIVPDSMFTLTLRDGSEQSFHVELDMGTMTSAKRMKERLKAYLLYAKEHPAPVLFIVPDENRQALIARYAKEEASLIAGDSTIFWIAVKNTINEDTVFAGKIWQVVGGPAALSLAEAALGKATPTPAYKLDRAVLTGGSLS